MDRLIRVLLMVMIAGSMGMVVYRDSQAAGAEKSGTGAVVQTKESSKETQLKEFKKELDELDKKAKALAAKARTDIAQQKKEFKKTHKAAEKKLEALKSDASRKWEDVKPELEAALANVKKAFEKLHSQSEEGSKSSK
jgi:hypothetical protein